MISGIADDDVVFQPYTDLSNLTIRNVQRECQLAESQFNNKNFTGKLDFNITDLGQSWANSRAADQS